MLPKTAFSPQMLITGLKDPLKRVLLLRTSNFFKLKVPSLFHEKNFAGSS
jgi:hypothetical protein